MEDNYNRDGCEFGRQLTKDVEKIGDEVMDIKECIKELKDRPTWTVVTIITILTATVAAMLGSMA